MPEKSLAKMLSTMSKSLVMSLTYTGPYLRSKSCVITLLQQRPPRLLLVAHARARTHNTRQHAHTQHTADAHEEILDHVLQALGDFRLAAARHGGGLVQVGSLRQDALEVPRLVPVCARTTDLSRPPLCVSARRAQVTESEGVRHTDNAYVPDLVAFLPEPLTISVEPLFTISTLYPEGSTCTHGRACRRHRSAFFRSGRQVRVPQSHR